ncbi:MAG: hypothetical protein ACLUSL_09955 [Ruminococcus sp.]
MTASNQRYPSIAQLRKKLQMLYGAAIFGSVQREGDIQTNHISATVIDDRYALEQEPLFDEVPELLLDCLFLPQRRRRRILPDRIPHQAAEPAGHHQGGDR